MFDKLLTVGIVIGNEDTGYGFLTRRDHNKDSSKYSRKIWSSRKDECSSMTPTCILFTKDKVFHSFGYESKNKYTELVEDNEHEEWYFFEKFLSAMTMQEVCMLFFKYTKTRILC